MFALIGKAMGLVVFIAACIIILEYCGGDIPGFGCDGGLP